MKNPELRLCGLPAVMARWKRSPESVQRLFFDRETGRRVGSLSRALAAARKVYRCVEAAELEKVAGTMHHGGIVAVVDAPELIEPGAAEIAAWGRAGEAVLVLDRVGNAHNLGALARSAAFFGVPHLVIADHPDAARPNDAAYRVAEGGFEALKVWKTARLPAFLGSLASAGYDVVGASTRGGARLLPGDGRRAAPRAGAAHGPVALVLGNEEHGMEPKVEAACTRKVTLAGGGVESLNVSVAGAVLIWELLVRRAKPAQRGGGQR